MRLLNLLTLACASSLLISPANAQLVQVGPGFVRAPFVRVYWGPGGSYVRAPFVSRYSGYAGDYPYSGRPISVQEQLEPLGWLELCQRIRSSCQQLDADLGRLASGNFWKQSLKIDEIASFVSVDSDIPPVEPVRRRLAEIVTTFDSIGNAPDFNRVAQLNSFQTLRGALHEYVMLPELRLRRQLSAAAGDLNQALNRFDTGPTWKDYFLVSTDQPLSEDRLRQDDSVATSDLADALARFDAASQNPDYSMISGLPAFKAMQARWNDYLSERQNPSIPSAEELPLPGGAPKS